MIRPEWRERERVAFDFIAFWKDSPALVLLHNARRNFAEEKKIFFPENLDIHNESAGKLGRKDFF